MEAFKFLIKFTWERQKKLILFSIFYQLVYAAIPLATVIFPRYIIDEIIGARRPMWIIALIATFLLLTNLGQMLLSFLNGRCVIYKGKLFVDFQASITENLALCDYERLESPDFLDSKEKARQFIFAGGQGFGVVLDNFFGLFGKLFVFLGIVAIVMQMNVLILLLFLVLVLVNSFFEARLKKRHVEWDLEKAPVERRTNYLISVIENTKYGKEIRGYGIHHWLIEKVRYYLMKAQEFYKKQVGLTLKGQVIASATTLLSEAATYGYLAWRLFLSAITVGEFTMYVSAMSNFNATMRAFMESILEIRRFSGYYSALSYYMNTPRLMRSSGEQEIPSKVESIEFDHVSFKYSGQQEYALRDVSFTIHAGEKLSVVGENGAGKSTFIKLICRLYDPTEGVIRVNGVDIKEYDYDEYQKLFSSVFQDYQLFSFSLKDNIAFDKPAEDAEVARVLERSGFDLQSKKRSHGIYTFVNKDFEPDGFAPSGGEGQKIALARALFKDAAIVLLDEPTAALDPRAEYELYQKFYDLVESKTALFVSHRLASSKFCDRVLVFQNGTLVEDGSHDELMANGGLYSELFQMQAQFYEE